MDGGARSWARELACLMLALSHGVNRAHVTISGEQGGAGVPASRVAAVVRIKRQTETPAADDSESRSSLVQHEYSKWLSLKH